ncbi:hypothetical protein E1B28_008201 [Marasmius oreades]|uniref:CFEM domain-containing protein n=1 Tax=Marasmius oreades TaxID=181124 RepID=A0A9P7RZE6_9AGAR|nr:uncharacterized protein E1B28_008201 [Marasmius oreades]KAG7091798.1 hypothetical protein E1B28_008201 [Marasmius oreades]
MVATRTLFVPFLLVAAALATDVDSEFGSVEALAPDCKSTCDPVQKTADGCSQTDIKCLCTDNNSDAFAKCFDCAAGHVNNATITSQLQGLMDAYVGACKSGGVTVKSQTIRANGALSLHSTVGATAAMGLVIVGMFSML